MSNHVRKNSSRNHPMNKIDQLIGDLRKLSEDDTLEVLDAVYGLNKDNDGQFLVYTEIFDNKN